MKVNINENEASSRSQKQKILEYMQSGKRVTPLDALHYWNCFRLGARIADLRADGHEIKSEFVTTPTGKRVKAYWIQG